MTESTESRSSDLVRIGPWWTLPLVIVASVLANVVIWAAALRFGPPGLARFVPLTNPITLIVFTALGAVGAYVLLWVLAQVTSRPALLFVSIALLALVISFVPELMLPGISTWQGFAIGTLIALHVAATVIDVILLLWIFERANQPPAG